ncbi:coproporphyrinogen III oxidase [Dentipellis sp. KUC8613]|nr:coproporphyrinogen III oxidase [Dentipellis sp. KUC8613]
MTSSGSSPMRQQVTEYITHIQERIVASLEGLDPSSDPFRRRSWSRHEGGGGVSCTFGRGKPDSVLEKAAVNISMIHGTLPAPAVRQMSSAHAALLTDPIDDSRLPFFAAGISIILHARNPNVPAVHANYRYFEATTGTNLAWWFGGITDLTPSYLFGDDARHFHRTLKDVCDTHGPALYPVFKRCCDDYLYIPHRGEHRGLGGIRFDNFSDMPHPLLLDEDLQRPRTPAEIFAFIKDLADAFLPSYLPIVRLRSHLPYDDGMRRWLLLRRGRSVEFSLVYERGTKFGLAAPGVDPENVLAGMPEEARWEYMSDLGYEEGCEEQRMLEVLKAPREWA